MVISERLREGKRREERVRKSIGTAILE